MISGTLLYFHLLKCNNTFLNIHFVVLNKDTVMQFIEISGPTVSQVVYITNQLYYSYKCNV